MSPKSTDPAARPDIVSVIAGANEDDYKHVQDRIASLTSELESLKAVERILAVKLGKTTPRAAPTRKGPSQGAITGERRVKLAKYLLHTGVQVPTSVLQRELDIPSGSINGVLDHPWFVKASNGNGWILSPEGRRAAAD